MKITFFRTPRREKKTRKKSFGPYSFDRCECGCTDYPGIGFLFFFFGISVQFTNK